MRSRVPHALDPPDPGYHRSLRGAEALAPGRMSVRNDRCGDRGAGVGTDAERPGYSPADVATILNRSPATGMVLAQQPKEGYRPEA
jgi:hypothetical protein